MPSPVVADTGIQRGSGMVRASASPIASSETPGRCGSRSILVTRTRSALWNITGYLSGLSSPSVTDSTTTLAAWPRS